MSNYLTRLKERKRHVYSWAGEPLQVNRRLPQLEYEGIQIQCEGASVKHCINVGDFVLVKSEDEDRPYIAKLLKLFENGNQQHPAKSAVVQWFARIEEIPKTKQKLLGRETHPKEIFLYGVPDCDDHISAETLVKAVKVFQIGPNEPFPPVEPDDGDVMFVKLNWNGKNFNILPKNTFSDKKTKKDSHRKKLESLPISVQKASDANYFSKQNTIGNDCESEFHSEANGDGTLGGKVINHKCKNGIVKMITEEKSNYSDQKNSNGKRITQIPNMESDKSKVRRKLPLCDFSKTPGRKLRNVLSELLDDDDDDVLARKLCQVVEPGAIKRKEAFNSISDDALLPCKKFQNKAISPLKMTRGKLNNQVATFNLMPIDSKIKQQDSMSQSRRNVKIIDFPKSKKMESKMENISGTPRSCRKSAQCCSAVLKQYLKDDQSGEESSEDEFLPDNELSSENEEQEDDLPFDRKSAKVFPKTPKATAKKLVKTPSKTPVPRTPRTPRTPCNPTPSIPQRNQLAKKPVSVLEEARARLHVSAVPESLPCREQEFQDIYNYVESKVIDGTGGCMYISGVPGTGKTATVHEVMRCLQHAAKQDNLPSFQFIEINGMKLTDPHQCYVQILKLLTGEKATAHHAAALLEKRFGTPAPKRETTVLLVDELDLLWTQKQNVMYNLFDWPTRKQAKLVVLAVANTMDLPERIMMNRVASRLGLTRMSFQPYTYKQLQRIICSRLNRLKAFEDDAIQLVGRKVAALSGDARRALDICRRAAEICEYSAAQQAASNLVGMPHVVQALDEMFSSPYITAIRNASAQEQIFMRAVLAEFQRLGLEEATFQQIYQQHMGLCRMDGLQPPTMSQTMLICTRLGACRLLLVESSKNDLHMRVRLNVSQDDVMYALKEKSVK
ncbi:origin recognition complex subunit 1 [Scyliorhinus canicula]|uniref:origin recognition complex subunit 1 n=1 Tax=Scyliorhinus canicula TaxID=7830 RepID=UPI0018F4E32D|nr:origin recognition complex subunit 1 [Scyliorhinus canicula]